MPEHDQPGPEDQGFTAPDLEADSVADAEKSTEPEQSREQREAEINRRFFQDLRQEYERELESIATDREVTQQALDKEKAVEEDFRSQRAIDFFERRLKTNDEIVQVVQERLTQIDTQLARLDGENSPAAA